MEMELYKYPGIRQCTYGELDEFLTRTLRSLYGYVPMGHAATVYQEMAREHVKIEGVSTEGASWAMEASK
jgi:hypothetical protein